MKQLFESEEEAIKWVGLNIALMIKPKKKAKTIFINPFSSSDAYIQVIEDLGKKIFKHQQTKKS
jgi:hypothetical protein